MIRPIWADGTPLLLVECEGVSIWKHLWTSLFLELSSQIFKLDLLLLECVWINLRPLVSAYMSFSLTAPLRGRWILSGMILHWGLLCMISLFRLILYELAIRWFIFCYVFSTWIENRILLFSWSASSSFCRLHTFILRLLLLLNNLIPQMLSVYEVNILLHPSLLWLRLVLNILTSFTLLVRWSWRVSIILGLVISRTL